MRKLHAAAALVEDEAVLDRQAVNGSQERQAGLLGAVDDPDVEADLGLDGLDQVGPVRRGSDGLGGHGDGRVGPRPARQDLEVAQRVEGSFDGLPAQLAVVLELARQAKGDAGVGDRLEVAARARSEDRHPAGVRAEVDDGERSRPATGFRVPSCRGRVAASHRPGFFHGLARSKPAEAAGWASSTISRP